MFHKSRVFLDQVSDYQLPQKESVTLNLLVINLLDRKSRWCVQMRPNFSCSCCRDSRWLLPVCTDSSTDTVANRSSTWLQLIALLGLVKPSTFTETHEAEREHEQSECTFTRIPEGRNLQPVTSSVAKCKGAACSLRMNTIISPLEEMHTYLPIAFAFSGISPINHAPNTTA
jgi:hypothetical protein